MIRLPAIFFAQSTELHIVKKEIPLQLIRFNEVLKTLIIIYLKEDWELYKKRVASAAQNSGDGRLGDRPFYH